MDQLSLTFHALADPTRRAILMRLAESDATVNELAEPFDLRLPLSRSTSRCCRKRPSFPRPAKHSDGTAISKPKP